MQGERKRLNFMREQESVDEGRSKKLIKKIIDRRNKRKNNNYNISPLG